MRVCGYARVSTDLQREKETIKTQVELIEKYCAANGHTLVEIFCDDGVSGATYLHERPGAGRLLEAARAGKVRGIVVYKADRIARDTLVAETAVRDIYEGLGIAFLGIAETIDLATPIGRAMFTFQSAIGRLERENTLQRSRDATLRLAREGVWLGGICPFGYYVAGKDREARLCVSDDLIPGMDVSEADVVRQIYHWSGEEGLSSIQIADRLNAMGVPTVYARAGREVLFNKRKRKTQQIWRAGRVRNMLIEPVYKGVHFWGRRGSKRKVRPGAGQAAAPSIIERQVPAIVDEALWNKAQVTLHNNRLCRPDIEKRPYLLRGLMKCQECGLTWIGTVSPGKHISLATPEELEGAEVRGEQLLRPYYCCNGSHSRQRIYGQPDGQSDGVCRSGYARAVDLEALVWNEIESFLFTPEAVVDELRTHLLEQFAGIGEVEAQLSILHHQSTLIDDERAVLYRLFRRGGISDTDLERQLLELEGEEKTLTQSIERLEKEVARAQDANTALTSAQDYLARLRQKLESELEETGEVSWPTKRRIVEALVAHIEVESHFDDLRKHGQQRRVSLHTTYRFEEPDATSLKPRTGKSPRHIPGLSIQRTLHLEPKTQARKDAKAALVKAELVKATLEGKAQLRIEDIIDSVWRAHGVKLSKAGVCRIRQELGMAPDTLQSKAAKARYAKHTVIGVATT